MNDHAASKLASLLAQDTPTGDPSDFPRDAAFLATLDAALRCQICKNPYDGPVSLACGHCFDSACVRGFMQASATSRSQCPICRRDMTESHLRPNPVLEEAVGAWKRARGYVLDLAREKAQSPALSDEPVKKRRRLSPGPCVPGPSRTEDADTIVECPLCMVMMEYRALNAHMDNNCSSTPGKSQQQKNQWMDVMGTKSKGKAKATANDSEPLPKVAYDTLKEKQLRDKLSEHGLPTTGSHSQMAARHQRWTLLWNANLDKSLPNRQGTAQLRKELKRWEEEQKNRKKKKPVDGRSYLASQKTEFAKLVAQARPKGT